MSVTRLVEMGCDVCGWVFIARTARSARTLDGWHRQKQKDGRRLDICGNCWASLHPPRTASQTESAGGSDR